MIEVLLPNPPCTVGAPVYSHDRGTVIMLGCPHPVVVGGGGGGGGAPRVSAVSPPQGMELFITRFYSKANPSKVPCKNNVSL